MSNRYEWKRFWCPRDGHLNLSDGGYLSDPDGPYGSVVNPDVVSFESLADIPCLVLLGEPGIGKSTESHRQFMAIQNQAQAHGNDALVFDLRDYQTDMLLRDDIFRHPRLQAWISQTSQLHLYLDSLDEGLLSVNTLATLLASELKKYPIERLFLRIACRTAEWPSILEKGLMSLWGQDQVKVVELAPLRRIDVDQAAQTVGVDPEAFLEAVRQRDAVPLAIKPLTFEFLLRAFKKHQQFPGTKAELYASGCLLLCEEQNESRLVSGRTSRLSGKQLLAVASRIAAVTVFCNRSAIWTATSTTEAPEGDATLMELAGAKEKADGSWFTVGVEQIRETLSTGLFTARGPMRLGWSHQTFAEYLAAYFLKSHGVSPEQSMGLLSHPGDQEGRLIPQLHETAAWLANIDQEAFSLIAAADPQVLLRSDIAATSDANRSQLIANLLRFFEEEKLLDSDWNLRARYFKLSHPDISEQLRPYISDPSKNGVVRRVAIDIAEACHATSLQDDLVQIALGVQEPTWTRIEAAYGVIRIGNKETRKALLPLAAEQLAPDSDDELKGCALQAVWPDCLSAEELFSRLTVPQRSNFLGAYAKFLSQDIVQHLRPNDLPLALKWMSEKMPGSPRHPHFGILGNHITTAAWEHLDLPMVAESLAEVIISRLEFDSTDTSQSASDDNRRRVIEAIIPHLPFLTDKQVWLVHARSPLVKKIDLPWLVERFKQETNLDVKQVIAELVRLVFDFRSPGHLDLISVVAKTEPLIAERFSPLLEPVDLQSPEAEQQKSLYYREQESLKRRDKTDIQSTPPEDKTPLYLSQFESGNIDAWWHLNLYLAVAPGADHFYESEPDIVLMPKWEITDDSTKSRIVRAAQQYLSLGDPHTDKWLGTSTHQRPALAGYRALLLLQKVQPDFISTLPGHIWRKWAPIILAYPHTGDAHIEEPHVGLVRLAYQFAKEQVLETVGRLIDKEGKEPGHMFFLAQLSACWDSDIAALLLEKAKSPELHFQATGQLLEELLTRGVDDARIYAESLITGRRQPENQELIKTAARALFCHAPVLSWPVLWSLLQDDAVFGKEVIATSAHNLRSVGLAAIQQLPEEHIADLYVWLVRQYPYVDDPPHEEAYFVGTDDSAREFRGTLLNILKSRGTEKAVNALRSVVEALPDLDWLRWAVVEAQNEKRRHTWAPLPPQALVELVQDQDKRLVQSGEQLLAVVIESLRRLEMKLQGETPAAFDLWNEVTIQRKITYRPKSENHLSDYVKRHLQDDLVERGIIMNREVEIRRGTGDGGGEHTDIHVDAVVDGPQDSYDRITVIIEAKGCWYKELKTAMESQLKDRYLKDSHCRHGLYLVGWFNCPKWDQSDRRQKDASKLDKRETQRFLKDQAAGLSGEGLVIRSLVVNTAVR